MLLIDYILDLKKLMNSLKQGIKLPLNLNDLKAWIIDKKKGFNQRVDLILLAKEKGMPNFNNSYKRKG